MAELDTRSMVKQGAGHRSNLDGTVALFTGAARGQRRRIVIISCAAGIKGSCPFRAIEVADVR
jgi:hypothetical protein